MTTQKTSNSGQCKGEEACGKEKKPAFHRRNYFFFDDNGRNLGSWQPGMVHNTNHGLGCTKEALQQKFNKLRNSKIPTGNPHCPANVWLAKKVPQMMVQQSNAVDLEDVPAMDKAGDDNLLASGVYSEYDSAPADYANTFFNVTPAAKISI
jgi:hypothetical protein